MGYREPSEEEIKLRLGEYRSEDYEGEYKEEKREEKDVVMSYRKLSKKDKSKIEKYLDYVGEHLSRLESGKKGNFYVIMDNEDLLHPGAALKPVPLNFPRGEFRYFSKLENLLSKILKKRKISEKLALNLKLNEEIDEEAFANSL